MKTCKNCECPATKTSELVVEYLQRIISGRLNRANSKNPTVQHKSYSLLIKMCVPDSNVFDAHSLPIHRNLHLQGRIPVILLENLRTMNHLVKIKKSQ